MFYMYNKLLNLALNIAFRDCGLCLLLCGNTTGTSYGRKRSWGAGQSPANILNLKNNFDKIVARYSINKCKKRINLYSDNVYYVNLSMLFFYRLYYDIVIIIPTKTTCI